MTELGTRGYYWDRAKELAGLSADRPAVLALFKALCIVADQIRAEDARIASEAGCGDATCHAPDHRLAALISRKIASTDIPDVRRCSDCGADVGECECN